MRWTTATLLAGVVLLAACSARQVLVDKPAAVPAGVDLSGQWLLRDTAGTTQPSARETLVFAFYESGKSVKVTQTESGLFVSFDRSVVEEYRFGESRNVSVGEIAAERVSGWERNGYVIETLDKDGARLIDSYRLADDGAALTRETTIRSRNNRQLMSLQQVFDRV